MLVLITGGSGSGKSAYAEKLTASLHGAAHVYLATMQDCGDPETRQRIHRHRAMRAGKGFVTAEQPLDIAAAPIPDNSAVLLECLPNLVANEMFGGRPDRIRPGLEDLMRRCASLIVVTDTVDRDGVAYTEGTAAWLRCLNETAAFIGERADLVVEVVCGIPIPVKGALPCV